MIKNNYNKKLIIDIVNKEIYYFKNSNLLNEIAKDKLVHYILNRLFYLINNDKNKDIILILSNIIYKHNNKSILSQYNKNGEVVIYLKVYRNKINNTNINPQEGNFYIKDRKTDLLFNDIFTLNNNDNINPILQENSINYINNSNTIKEDEKIDLNSNKDNINNIPNKNELLNILSNLLYLYKLDNIYNNKNIVNNYIEYYLIKIYNKVVKLKIIELSNPGLSPQILGENIKILFSKGIGAASAKEIMN